MNHSISRRAFLKTSLFTTAGFWVATGTGFARKISTNEKLNLGVIGTINRASANLNALRDQNIVAICDIEDKLLSAAQTKFPQAKTYTDFRKMLDRRDLDGIVVSTPDHTHAVATIAALKSGRHVYCEKPLAHDVFEVRAVTNAAAKYKLATQMGTQIHATANYRRVVEVDRGGGHWAGQGGSRLVRKSVGRRRTARGNPARSCGVALGPVAWPGVEAALPFRVPSESVAAVVGFRRRHIGRHGLPLHRLAVLGFEAALPDQHRGRGSAGESGDHTRLADRALPIRSAGAAAGGATDLV